MCQEINCQSHKCHNLSLFNSCVDIFIIEPCLIEKDKENNNTDVKLISWLRLSRVVNERSYEAAQDVKTI